MVPTRQFARDAVGAIAFKLRGDTVTTRAVAKVRERILRAVQGTRQQDLVALNETIVPKLLDKVRPEAKKLLESHHLRGHATYIVSAAPVEIVEPLALALGMTPASAPGPSSTTASTRASWPGRSATAPAR